MTYATAVTLGAVLLALAVVYVLGYRGRDRTSRTPTTPTLATPPTWRSIIDRIVTELAFGVRLIAGAAITIMFIGLALDQLHADQALDRAGQFITDQFDGYAHIVQLVRDTPDVPTGRSPTGSTAQEGTAPPGHASQSPDPATP